MAKRVNIEQFIIYCYKSYTLFNCRCIEYFVETHPSISHQDLFEKTYEQFKLSDIADIGLGCLPDGVNHADLVELSASYVLQMQFVIDIGNIY